MREPASSVLRLVKPRFQRDGEISPVPHCVNRETEDFWKNLQYGSFRPLKKERGAPQTVREIDFSDGMSVRII